MKHIRLPLKIEKWFSFETLGSIISASSHWGFSRSDERFKDCGIDLRESLKTTTGSSKIRKHTILCHFQKYKPPCNNCNIVGHAILNWIWIKLTDIK